MLDGLRAFSITVRSVGIALALVFLNLAGDASGQVPAPTAIQTVWQRHLAGAQLGPWISSDFGKDIMNPNLQLRADQTAIHLEFFFQPHLVGVLNGDLNLGAINRGDLRVTTPDRLSFLGEATLYPVGAGVAVFPLSTVSNWRVQPVVRIGTSLVIGTMRVGTGYLDPQGIGISTQPRTAWGYYAGAGLAWMAFSRVALVGNVKYQSANFDKELFGVRDYSGVQILFGAAYAYR